MDFVDIQRKVLNWAETADSFDKLGFLKALAQTFGKIEIHHAKNILGHALKKKENRVREWIGPNFKESRDRHQDTVANSEKRSARSTSDENTILSRPSVSRRMVFPDEIAAHEYYNSESRATNYQSSFGGSSLSRPFVSRRVELPKSWWENFKEYLGYDVEHVHLKNVGSCERIRAGRLAVVDWTYEVVYKDEVYHQPNTYLTHREMVKKSGIGPLDLQNGTDMSTVKHILLKLFQEPGTLPVIVGGVIDFTCADLMKKPEDDFEYFDLQWYYRRSGDNPGDPSKGMSLRDAYFMEFQEDCQGITTHSAEADARATLRLFIEGYLVRNKNQITRENKYHYEIFDSAVRLKAKDKEKIYFCNSKKIFIDWKITRCHCSSCNQLFSK